MGVDYRVRLDSFEGPLDLLLHLIRRAEVEITDIPIALVADQYVSFLHAGGLERIDIEAAGEFLVMAATLMEIKSRMLTPQPAGCADDALAAGGAATGDAADPRADLVRQLLAYKRFRDAASELDRRRTEWEVRMPVAGAGTPSEALREEMLKRAEDVELEDLTTTDLAEAFARIAATMVFDRLGDHEVTYDDTPIELHAEDVLDRLRRAHAEGAERLTLRELVAGRRRSEMIGLFLATLELVRRRLVKVTQEDPGAPICLEIRPPEAEGGAPA